MGQQNKCTDRANVNALHILKYLKNVKPIYSLFICVGFSKNFEKTVLYNPESTGAADSVYPAVPGVLRGFPTFIDTCNVCRSNLFVPYPL
jgi:hypothetical protein